MSLHIRWLGSVKYNEASELQHALYGRSEQDHLLLLEHPHVYTLGVRTDMANVLVDPQSVGAECIRADRGGDVTYHGPGQLVGYPILSLVTKRGGGMADTVAYVNTVEQLVIDTCKELGLNDVGRLRDYPGVWVEPESENPRKIAAIGVRLNGGRTMHGFALNVDPDMGFYDHIVPCGISDKAVTSLALEGIKTTMQEVVDVVASLATEVWGDESTERQDVVWRHRETDLSLFSRGAGPGTIDKPKQEGTSVRLRSRLDEAGVDEGLSIATLKPKWLKAKLEITPDYLRLKKTMRSLDLVTVCEEARCPNISECWTDGTATFMILGERCTRACGFCNVDTRKPLAVDQDEPNRVAKAVAELGLKFAVVTMVARDDLEDGGAAAIAATITAIRERSPGTQVEVLISDLAGDLDDLDIVLAAHPDVLNHNVETVPRLQRAVRPSASYARSLAVLAHAKAKGFTTKTSIIVGMGETDSEIEGILVDLRGIGCDIVTIGQYLRPTSHHLPVERWVELAEFEHLKAYGEDLGISHVESSPLTRSSYHAREAAEGAGASRLELADS